ncbi:hypothetical protein D9613_004154 [Agrocybe pediades]|uniref:Uncharacterized protein n=1 Tax=Agrocybe pediades TaxID=84607 RepID=A0A8H4QIN4_9AGAR|nr:hypothetical protein D9613_004154 [Agrocybe pediades]
MLVLSKLHSILSQILSPPNLHTSMLFTPAGELVSYACEPVRPKDDIRIIVGLCGEVWQETREQGYGMVETELGRIIVLPVDDYSEGAEPVFSEEHPPMLLVLNSTDAVEWEELLNKGQTLATHLAKPLSKFRDVMTPVPKRSTSSSAAMSPAALRVP